MKTRVTQNEQQEYRHRRNLLLLVGGHMELMASLITGGTILAVITMPLMLWIFG